MIPDSFIQELLARVDIVDVISRYVNLRKGGANLLGLCPFHNEKTPSFTVSPTKQFYHCFGCGAHGSAIRFLTQHTGQTFPEAVQTLAASVGMVVPENQQTPEQRRQHRESKSQIALEQSLLEQAKHFYCQNLKQSPKAIAYLKKRGIDGKTAAAFGLGWAGSDRRNLAKVFPQYEDSALLETGLVIESDNGNRYDRFRDRVIFPINNSRGNLIGFGGRLVDPGEPKYLNSPETRLFSKGHELYGLYEARAGIRNYGYVLVVEGYMDVISLAQFGLNNAVATLGTATTAEHIQKLRRTTDKIVFSFDGDNAGRKAAWRALQTCLPCVAEDLSIRFLFLPDGHDPDSYIREFGVEATNSYVNEALALSTFMLQELNARHNLAEAEGRSACVHEARPLFAMMPEGGYKLQLKREFALQVKLTPEELDRVLDAVKIKETVPTKSTVGAKSFGSAADDSPFLSKPIKRFAYTKNRGKSPAVIPMAKRLLGLLLSYPDLVSSINEQQLELLAKHPHLQLVKEMVNLVGRCGATHTGAILEAADTDSDLSYALQDISTTLLIDELPEPLTEWNDALRKLEVQYIKDECDSLIANGLSTVEQQELYKMLQKRLHLLR